MRHRGFSLIELLVAIAMVGILAGLAVAGSVNLVRKYRVESEAKELYSDLMDARIRAMHKNRTHFVDLRDSSSYSVNDDSGLLFPAKTLGFPIAKLSDSGTTVDSVGFNSRGLAQINNTQMDTDIVCICINSQVKPSYDCVTISSTRVSLGQLQTQGACNSANCTAQ